MLSSHLPLIAFPIGLSAAFVSATLMSGILRLSDKDSVTSIRRILGLGFVSTVVWILPLAMGALVSMVTSNPQPAINETIFGFFLAWAFELVVINGIFLKNATKSLFLAALHPGSILGIIFLSQSRIDGYPIIAGGVTLALALLFLLRLNTFKTNEGLSSIQMLHAFAKTWIIQRPEELERYFARYSKEDSVTTDVFLFKCTDRQVAMVLPGIHPGPFYPVGSYNVSELVYRKLAEIGTIGLVFHGTGGHERNVPSNELAVKYAEELVQSIPKLPLEGNKTIKGPVRSTVGSTNVTSIAFGQQIIAFETSAPYESEDLDPATLADFYQAALDSGMRLSVIDAHNSIGRKAPSPINPRKDDWNQIIDRIRRAPEREFKIGYAHSSETGFNHGSDISDGGINLIDLAVDGHEFLIIAADSNNAVSGLRGRIAEEVEKMGGELVEFCTSDSHNLAARRLINRGYFALGEDTKPEEIVGEITRLVGIARKRMEEYTVTTMRFEIKLPLIGNKALVDFAKLTKEAMSFAKAFGKVLLPTIVILLLTTFFY